MTSQSETPIYDTLIRLVIVSQFELAYNFDVRRVTQFFIAILSMPKRCDYIERGDYLGYKQH